MNFTDAKELRKHAIKCRYGIWRFFVLGTPSDIKSKVLTTIERIRNDDGEFDAHQARLDFVREFPIHD